MQYSASMMTSAEIQQQTAASRDLAASTKPRRPRAPRKPKQIVAPIAVAMNIPFPPRRLRRKGKDAIVIRTNAAGTVISIGGGTVGVAMEKLSGDTVAGIAEAISTRLGF